MTDNLLMRRDLTAPIAPAELPASTTLVPFTKETARTARELMQRIYPEGLSDGGISFEGFWTWLTAEPQYDPRLAFVAASDNAVIGFCHCWRDDFIKNLVVDVDFRGRGLGSALLTLALQEFARRGARSVDLTTEAENAKAQSLYQRLGFIIVERFEK